MNLSGPYLLRLGFHIFVVIVGGLILSGAVNTSIIGANGVLNRVAEDGVLLPWFRKPHKRYGTTYRMINMIVLLQIATIIGSRGDMTVLAEAYAFGVVWSFFMKALGVIVLRFQRTDQEYKVPFNIRIGGVRNSRRPGRDHAGAGIRGASPICSPSRSPPSTASRSRIVFFVMFTISEQINMRRKDSDHKGWSSSIWITRRRSMPAACTPAPAACWWPCAITTAWST